MKPLECVDLGCGGKDAAGRCRSFWLCLVALSDHLTYLLMVFLAVGYMIGSGIVIHAGHAAPETFTLCSAWGTMVGIILYALKARVDRAEDKKAVKEVAEAAATTREVIEKKVEAVSAKQDEVAVDIKAAAVAAKVGVKQNVDILTAAEEIKSKVNGGLEKATAEAFAAGVEKGRSDSNPG